MTKAKTDKTYRELSDELDEIVSAMQADSGDVDELMQRYEKGLKIIAELEARLQTVQATVTELKERSESGSV